MVLEVLSQEGDWELRFQVVDLCKSFSNDVGELLIVFEILDLLVHLKLYIYR